MEVRRAVRDTPKTPGGGAEGPARLERVPLATRPALRRLTRPTHARSGVEPRPAGWATGEPLLCPAGGGRSAAEASEPAGLSGYFSRKGVGARVLRMLLIP